MRSPIRNYLSITKKEWNGMVVLVVLIALILVPPYVYQQFGKDTTINPKEFNNALAELARAKKSRGDDHPSAAPIFAKKAAYGVFIELNTAESANLTGLRGIGPSFAMCIIRHRDRSGGFYRKEQLKEVLGLDCGTNADMQAQVRVDPAQVKKIPVNSVTFEGLSHSFTTPTSKRIPSLISANSTVLILPLTI